MNQPLAFRLCLDLLEAEKDLSPGGIPAVVDTLRRLSESISSSSLSTNTLHQITPIIFKTISRLLSSSIDVGTCAVVHMKMAVACVDCELQLIKSLSNGSKLETVYQNSSDTFSKLLFLNIAVLECVKASSSGSDGEHMLISCLDFFATVLCTWGTQLGSSPALTGPYLAQLVQSCLVYVSHRSKEVAHKALHVLSALLSSLYDGHVSDWRTFYPGIFGGLYTSCCAGYKRGTAVLVLSLDCLLRVTTLVTADARNAHIIGASPSTSASSRAAFDEIVRKASGIKDTNPTSAITSRDTEGKGNITHDRGSTVNRNDGMPITEANHKWRADTAQRVAHHLPAAFRVVWSGIPPTAVRQRKQLMSSLSCLIQSSSLFFGRVPTSDFMVLLLECTLDPMPEISDFAKERVDAMKCILSHAMWTDLQSSFISRFVDAVWEVGRLAPSDGGGSKEEAITSQLSTALASGMALPRQALESCVAILLSSSTTKSESYDSKHEVVVHKQSPWRKYERKWGGLSCLQRLFVPDISPSTGPAKRTCILCSKRYFSSSREIYVDAGYYRAPYMHLREGGSMAGNRASSDVPLPPSTTIGRGIAVAAQLAALIGSVEVVADALVELWRYALRKSIKHASRSSYFQRNANTGSGNDDDEASNSHLKDDTLSKTSNIKMAIAATNLLMFAVQRQEKENDVCEDPSLNDLRVECGFCGAPGVKGEAAQSLPVRKELPVMLRCSKCKTTYYCSKSHQISHWSVHKGKCKKTTEIKTRIVGDDSIADDVKVPKVPERFSGSACSAELCKSIITSIVSFLQDFLSLETTYHNSRNSETSINATLMELLVSGVLELLAALGCAFPETLRECLMEVLVPLLCVCMHEGATGSGAGSVGIARQASLSTLSRITLDLGYRSGRHLLRHNLDYIVDEVCSILRFVRRTDMHSSALGIGHLHTGLRDDRIIRVVGAVFMEISSTETDSCDALPHTSKLVSGDDDRVEMLMRDMVNDALDATDSLCSDATQYATPSTPLIGYVDELNASRRAKHLLGPLLGLMYSLVVRACLPVSNLPEKYMPSSSKRILFPFPFVLTSMPRNSEVHELRTDRTKLKEDNGNESSNVSLSFDYDYIIASIQKFRKSLDRRKEVFSVVPEEPDLTSPAAVVGTEDEPEEAFSDDEEEDAQYKRPLEMIRNILERCCYFIAVNDIHAQIMVVATMTASFSRLANNRKVLLPAAHKAWPSIMNRFKEQRALFLSPYLRPSQLVSESGSTVGRSAYLLQHLLDLVSLLALICGDFMSIKFKDDLWDELVLIFHAISRDANDSLAKHLAQQHKQLASISDKQPAMQMKDVLLVESKSSEGRELPNVSQQSTTTSSLFVRTSHSMADKLKLAMLECLRHLAEIDFSNSVSQYVRRGKENNVNSSDEMFGPDIELFAARGTTSSNPMRSITPVCAFLLLPLLGSHEKQSVRDSAVKTLLSLHSLDSACVGAMLRSVYSSGFHSGGLASKYADITSNTENSTQLVESRSTAESVWAAVITLPEIVESYQRFGKLTGNKKSTLTAKYTSESKSGGFLLKEREASTRASVGVSNSSFNDSVPNEKDLLKHFTHDSSVLLSIRQVLLRE